MNKDVVYIEPEDDITDIIAKIKNAKNKIVALVPPKKAGVLRSAVNFKLIAKTALQHEKTVVLISTDEGLIKFAAGVRIPVAKSLSSKPSLAADEDDEEFGEDEDGDLIEEDVEEIAKEESTPKKSSSNSSSRAKAAPAKKPKNNDADMELSDEEESEDDEQSAKPSKKAAKNTTVPNFKKYRKQIIAGGVAALVLVVVLIWAFAIAPAAKIIVNVSTTARNFSESVSFVTDEADADVENGIFYAEQKTVEKTDSVDFEATGEVDKGTKASGTITVRRTSPVRMVLSGTKENTAASSALAIPAGTKLTYNGLTYVVSSEASLRGVKYTDVEDFGRDCDATDVAKTYTCIINVKITATISVVAEDNGDKYNMSAMNNGSGWNIALSGVAVESVKEITGGSSKIVKVVSEDDIANAEESLDVSSESDVKSELKSELGKEYILIDSSFNANGGTPTASPALNEEVANDSKPKLVKKTSYTIYAVKREDVAKYIEATVKASLGDDTQTVYTTGADEDAEKTKAFFESYKNSGSKMTAKLKSTVQTGPNVTEDMVSEKSLGKKTSEVKSSIGAINGVKSVEINTSGFWVTTVPNDSNKVEIEIKVED